MTILTIRGSHYCEFYGINIQNCGHEGMAKIPKDSDEEVRVLVCMAPFLTGAAVTLLENKETIGHRVILRYL